MNIIVSNERVLRIKTFKLIRILRVLESLVRVVACVDISTQCQLAHKMREII